MRSKLPATLIGRYPAKTAANGKRTLLLSLIILLCATGAIAQLPYSQSFMTSSAPGMIFGGTPVTSPPTVGFLTAGQTVSYPATGTVTDPANGGFLRLTPANTGTGGYAYNGTSFPANYGLRVSFEYFAYAGTTPPADGFSFFLFDAATTMFNIGQFGRGLGYAPDNGLPGVSNGYLGIGLDVYGNYTGNGASRVGVKGPGNGTAGYALLTDAAYSPGIASGTNVRVTNPISVGYRKVTIELAPKTVTGGYSYDITVKIESGTGTGTTTTTVINNYTGFTTAAPANLKYGFAGSTGLAAEVHEVRNLSVDAYNPPSATPTAVADNFTGCGAATVTMKVLNNDVPVNLPYGFDSTSVVLVDPTNSGLTGNSYTIAGVGTFSTSNAFGSKGEVTFVPASTFSGTASIDYKVKDNYGNLSNAATVSVNNSTVGTPNVSPAPLSQPICSGSAITTIVNSGTVSGTVYNWTRDNTASTTGIAASGSGNIAGSLTNTTAAPVTTTFTVTPTYINGDATCTGSTAQATVTVNPTPVATATPASQTICNGSVISTIALTSTITGTTYAWTRNNTTDVTGINASGTGNIGGSLTNALTGSSIPAATTTFTITPTANGCDGNAAIATVTVNPTPDVAQPNNQIVCANSATSVTFSGVSANTTYNWTNNTTSMGLAGIGTGSIGSFTAKNTSNAPVTATLTVAPVIASNSGATYAYVPNYASNNVSVINTSTNTVVGSPIAVSANPISAAYSPDGSRVYVGSFSGNDISIINTATNTVVGTYSVGGVQHTIAVSPDGSKVCASNFNSNTVAMINTATSAVTFITVGSTPCMLAFTPDGSKLYVANQLSNSVSVVNVATNAVSTINLSISPIGLTISPDGSKVYVADVTNTNNVSVISTSSNTVTGTFSLTGGSGFGLRGVTTNLDGTRLYVSGYGANVVWVVNTSNNSVVATIPVGSQPRGIGIAPDGSNVYVANSGGNTVSVINTTSNTVTSSITVGSQPYAYGQIIGKSGPCTGSSKTFTITVNPTPTVAKPSNQVVCNNTSTAAVTFSGTVTGTTYSWTVSGASIGLSNGSGSSIPAFNATNSTNAPVTATVMVTPSYANPAGGSACSGTAQTFTITVNPTPTAVATPSAQTVCDGVSTSTIVMSGAVSGTTYNWTNNTASVGLAASGSGDVSAFTPSNSTSAPITATISITPSYANGGATCTGSAVMATITVNPKYAVTASAGSNGGISPSGITNVCSGTNQSYSITSNSGYHVQDVMVDGSSVGAVTTYSFSNITTTHTINASFAVNCTPPSISCNNTAITQSTDAGLCSAVVNYTAATATGTAPSISYSQNSGTVFSKGLTTVTATATNGCGSDQCSFTVTVNDNQAPIAAAQNVTVNLSASGNASITAAQVNNGSTDNCGINSSLTSVTPSAFNCSNIPGVSSAGSAIAFTGGYIDVPDDASLNPQNTWTLETWVKTDPAYSGNQHSLIEKYDNGTMYGYLLRITSGNKLMAGLVTAGSASNGAYVTGSTTLTPGTWYHVAATYNISGQVSLYVNGQADGSVNSSTAGTMYSNPSTFSLRIGARGNDAGTRLHGSMDEVRIWNVEHNQVQIKATMNKSLSGTEAGLVAYYRFEEPSSSTTVIDNTPLTTANTGTLTGSVSRVASGAGVGGTTPVTLSVTDVNGNTSTTTAFVTIADNIAPTVVTKSATVYLDANGNATLSPSQVDNGSSDNCSFNLSVTPSSFTCNSLGSFAGTLNGNLTADNYFDAYLSTSDNTLGTSIGSGSNFTVTYALTAATLTPGTNYFLHIKGTDVGGPQSLLGDFTLTGNFEFANGLQTLSTNTANWHVNTTGFGNSYNTPVSYGVNAVSPWGNRSGISSNALNIWDPSGNNSSGGTEYAYFSTPIVYNPNKTTVTLTATDAGNNMTSAPATVSIVDNILPTITAPANVVVNGYCQNAPASAVILGSATAHDNCSIASITNNAPASYPVGTTTVRWTATDGSGNTNYADQTVTVNPATVAANASVTPLYPMSGQEIQTIYLGYPSTAQSETMSVSPTGGTGSYTFSWTSTGCGNSVNPLSNITSTSTASSADFTPGPGSGYICSGNNDNVYSFTVTITDSHGCATSATKKFNVVNPYVSTGDVQVCHKVAVRGGSTTQLLVVSPSQVSTHLAHGDYLGNCAVFTGVRSIPSAEVEEQKVAVYPNPTTGVFILELSSINEEANILITDAAGKLIAQKTIAKGAVPTATFDLGNLARGMYLIQVRDGELNYRTKIIVQ